jgi:hypothetical protein
MADGWFATGSTARDTEFNLDQVLSEEKKSGHESN